MIRNAEERDIKDILEIYWENYEEMFGVSRRKLMEIDRKIWGEDYPFLSIENLKKGLSKKYNIIVFEEEGKILGFALYYEDSEILLDEIHVRKGFRRKGVGRKLLNFLKKKGKRIVAYASEHSLKFFLKEGFQVVSSFVGYLGMRWYKVIWNP